MDTVDKIVKAAKEIEIENEKFDYVASDNEIAHQIWYSVLDSRERFVISSTVTGDFKNIKHKLKACISFIEDIIHKSTEVC